jgi:putative transposase
VRAGLCEDPEDYRWCSYAAAVSGDKVSRQGLARAWGRQRWTNVVAREYRVLLFGRGAAHTGGETASGRYVKAKPGFSRQQIEEEIKKGGHLPIWKVLRCRIRYFSDGAVLGSRSFVDSFFERERSRFGDKRETGARSSVFPWAALPVYGTSRRFPNIPCGNGYLSLLSLFL